MSALTEMKLKCKYIQGYIVAVSLPITNEYEVTVNRCWMAQWGH